MLLITGTTLNCCWLVNVPEGAVTVTNPVVPASGTTAVRYVSEMTEKFAEPVPNFTLVVPVVRYRGFARSVRQCPRS